MPISEFSIIEEYFLKGNQARNDVLLGIGDDAAITNVPPGSQLVTSVDTLVEGSHFTSQSLPFDVGYKSAAVNLSDLAAMGAEPCWASLALTLPEVNKEWLAAFSEGLFAMLNQYEVQLIGGDTTRGPLSITVQVFGSVTDGKALRRSNARSGDLIYTTGTLGDAGLGLQVTQGRCRLSSEHKEQVLAKLNCPVPRVKQGMVLRNYATAAIDVSDGLLADLSHILESSHVGAKLMPENLPLSAAVKSTHPESNGWVLPLSAGEDYELCFTVAKENCAAMEAAVELLDCQVSCIGEIMPGSGLHCILSNGEEIFPEHSGYDHFS